MESTSIEYPP